jgi:mono/diheme cytochrome c family protein
MFLRAAILCSTITLGLTPFATAGTRMALPKSVSVDLPDGTDPFVGADADAINQNCLACHSADMVLNQPAMTKAAWQAEVAKMIGTYKAPIAPQDVNAIVAYLNRTKGLN